MHKWESLKAWRELWEGCKLLWRCELLWRCPFYVVVPNDPLLSPHSAQPSPSCSSEIAAHPPHHGEILPIVDVREMDGGDVFTPDMDLVVVQVVLKHM